MVAGNRFIINESRLIMSPDILHRSSRSVRPSVCPSVRTIAGRSCVEMRSQVATNTHQSQLSAMTMNVILEHLKIFNVHLTTARQSNVHWIRHMLLTMADTYVHNYFFIPIHVLDR